ncbi:B12-binding domain-containing radical SAM protein [Roseospira visakhapatnamensis]|uniref:Radical SAM superfamily enzyme YgiQ (UPF0313 family) n=1 Tax=Roseospira visakhapatnamensis TaxID=390880 RepID=A0A7W6RB60_9PROT|nr:hypothetical protein [Roseospira visakhapatnamensis]MBB4265254.1 radical SAM superfamily enzyme YgiQ (UPF0313 family) [Roseospira visakhapatnamensis]
MQHTRSKVLIVNAYLDPWRASTPTRLFVPRAMAPYFLAGRFHRDRVEVRVHDEVHHGALLDRRLYAWPDLVILTGLTAAFDRARQLSAYFRHGRPGVVVAIGGPIARALPGLCARVFDLVCQGDVESVDAVIDEVLGPGHRADTPAPRFDLARSVFSPGFIETTKNCNFACAFCSLTGEGRDYVAHEDEDIARQIAAVDRVQMLMVLDNNFYGNNRSSFEGRVRLLGEHWRRGAFRGWGALVTGDFFKSPDNLALVAENGCLALFSGVESLDPAVLRTFNKRQSLASDPRSLSKTCAAHGIIFDYGMILDFTQQTIGDVDAQIDGLLADPEVPLPGLLSLTIPIFGTPYFDEAASAGRLMPHLRLSDLDGQKIVEWPREPLDRVVPYVAALLRFRGRKMALARHAVAHALTRRTDYRWEQTALELLRPLLRYGGTVRVGTPSQMWATLRESPATYCALTDTAPAAYRPRHWLPARFARDFEPFRVTDGTGALTDESRAERHAAGASAGVSPARSAASAAPAR